MTATYLEIKQYLKSFRPLLQFVRSVRRLKSSTGTAYRIVVDSYRFETQQEKLRLSREDPIQRYLELYSVRKLQVGTGYTPLIGWLNSDIAPTSDEIIYLDATKPFPFDDNSFDYMFSEHLIEHITFVEAQFMLLESYRILKPGGRIRIATPDIRRVVELYCPEINDLQTNYLESASMYFEKFFPSDIGTINKCFLVNLFFREWNHQFLYDFETLEASLKRAKFVDIHGYTVGESDDDNVRDIESHGRMIGDCMNRFETMVLEARKDGGH